MNPSQPLPHPRALAHLGDAVYELWIREEAILHHDKSAALHRYTIERAKADTQAGLLEALLPGLNETELDIVRRAQNMPVTSHRRNQQNAYRKATGFEALVGYWYLASPETLPQKRLDVLQQLALLVE